ncbi:MAG: NAD+ synthase [candidate division WOR-3 bacterium]
MKITLAQLNPTIGDFKGNLAKIKKSLLAAKKANSDLIIFPELFVTGYPARDLLEKEEFIEAAKATTLKVAQLSQEYPKIGIILGNITENPKKLGARLYNSAIFIFQGKIIFIQHKSCLPKTDVFDEPRYFEPSPDVKVFPFKGERLGISICADVWAGTPWAKREYEVFPIKELAKKRATIFINLSASPFYVGKEKIRYQVLRYQAKKYKTPIVYVNQVGGNDELIFDGRSMVLNEKGELVDILPAFKESIKTVDTSKFNRTISFTSQEEIADIHDALILGLRDYMRKCGFKKAIIGLSGGIDSSVTCSLAVKALGKENVLGVSMPSPFSSKSSVSDAKKLAKNLGIKLIKIPINDIYQSYLNSLKKYLGKKKKVTVVEENIQARIRGNILMALSNKIKDSIVISTGDKSELAVGYCTLYGDMSGGISLISDVPKNKVYKLAEYINRKKEIIPEEILKKPPSPELRPNQLTEKDLIPYKILDPIMEYYIEEKLPIREIIKKGFRPKDVKWVIKKIDRNEFKRRQAAPGFKVTSKAFGIGRRMPIAAKYDFNIKDFSKILKRK